MTKTYTCAIIIPVGPGHEILCNEALTSVNESFKKNAGLFSEIIPIQIDDHEGILGRSKARNTGIQKAMEMGIEWLFFLDADDLMVPRSFEYVAPYLEDYDAVWGSIWTIEQGETVLKPGDVGTLVLRVHFS